MLHRVVCIVWILAGVFSHGTDVIRHEYCMTESFQAECGANEVLMIDKALFGRMALGRCVTRNFGHVGCSADVHKQVDSKCSGRRKCEFSVSDAMLVRTKPCPKDFSSYLEAEYRCIAVHSEQIKDCTRSGYVHINGHQKGHLSSLDSNLDCPYRLEVLQGQQINLTLLDFRSNPRNASHDYSVSKYCEQFLVIEEKELGRSLTVCRQGERSKNVYTSKSHIVDVWVKDASIPFLLYFHAVGCPQFVPPEGAHTRLEDETLLVICNRSRDSYILTCRGGVWEGEVRNCTTTAKSELKDDESATNFIGLPPLGISIVIILGVALVVVVYVAIMIVCVLYLRKRRKETVRPGEQNNPPTMSSQDENFLDTFPKNAPSQEERLPMLMKGTIFRTSTGEYTDICEMHDLSSIKEYTMSMNSCNCGTCSPANVRRIHIPPARMDSTATLPTFRTFSAGSEQQQQQQKKIYDTARGLKTVKLVDRNLSSSSNVPHPQYYYQLDANNVHQQVGDNGGSGGGPDLVQGPKQPGEQSTAAAPSTRGDPAQYITAPRKLSDKS